MSILKVLSQVLKVGKTVAPIALTAVNPAAGAITSLVVEAVVKAEQAGGSGPDKKQQVMTQIVPMVAPMLAAFMQAGGSTVKLDSAGVNQSISQIVDGVVALLNAIDAPAGVSAAASPNPVA